MNRLNILYTYLLGAATALLMLGGCSDDTPDKPTDEENYVEKPLDWTRAFTCSTAATRRTVPAD